MCARRTNIDANTPGNLWYGTGRIEVNGVAVGATQGNATFRVAKTDHIPDLNGAAGEVEGTRFRFKEDAFLTFELVETDLQDLAYAISGVDVSSDASSEVLASSDDSSDVVGCIEATEYVHVTFVGEDCDGFATTIHLWNAIMDGDLEWVFEAGAHAHYTVTFKATYDPVDPDMRPWAIVHITA